MKQRAGFALVAAIAAIVMIAALVTAILFAAGQETRTSRYAILDNQVLAYAERAASRAIASFDAGMVSDRTTGSVAVYTLPRDDRVESRVFVTRLDSALFLVVSEASVVASDTPALRRRVGIVVQSTRDSLGVDRVSRVSGYAWSALY